MTDILIRRAVPRDGAALLVLLDAAYSPYRVAGIALPDVTAGIDVEITASRVWVAERDGACVGMLNLSTESDPAHLINVAVHPDAHGNGIGSLLIRKAISTARNAGCRQIALATHADIPGNRRLYQHLGWQVTAREGQKILMLRDIAP